MARQKLQAPLSNCGPNGFCTVVVITLLYMYLLQTEYYNRP